MIPCLKIMKRRKKKYLFKFTLCTVLLKAMGIKVIYKNALSRKLYFPPILALPFLSSQQ